MRIIKEGIVKPKVTELYCANCGCVAEVDDDVLAYLCPTQGCDGMMYPTEIKKLLEDSYWRRDIFPYYIRQGIIERKKVKMQTYLK